MPNTEDEMSKAQFLSSGGDNRIYAQSSGVVSSTQKKRERELSEKDTELVILEFNTY